MKAIISGLILLGIVCMFFYLFPILFKILLLIFIILGSLICLGVFSMLINYLIDNVIEGLK